MRHLHRHLKCLPGLIAGILMFAIVATSPASPAIAHQSWLYNRGSFRAVGGKNWVERNPTGTFHFKETARSSQFVELYDPSRQFGVRLYSSTVYISTPSNRKWSYLYHGRWEDTEKQPLNEDKLPVDRASLEAPAQHQAFPHLGHDYEVLGPATKIYNCIAWSIGVTDHWVWPGDRIEDFDRLYGQNGYRRIQGLDYSHRPDLDKIVLYASSKPNGRLVATHGARQLRDGSWSSKLGQLPLIRHLEPEDLDGNVYGVPVFVYVRPHRSPA